MIVYVGGFVVSEKITSFGLEDSPVAFGADFISVLFVITSCGVEDSSAAFGGSFFLFSKISLIFFFKPSAPVFSSSNWFWN